MPRPAPETMTAYLLALKTAHQELRKGGLDLFSSSATLTRMIQQHGLSPQQKVDATNMLEAIEAGIFGNGLAPRLTDELAGNDEWREGLNG